MRPPPCCPHLFPTARFSRALPCADPFQAHFSPGPSPGPLPSLFSGQGCPTHWPIFTLPCPTPPWPLSSLLVLRCSLLMVDVKLEGSRPPGRAERGWGPAPPKPFRAEPGQRPQGREGVAMQVITVGASLLCWPSPADQLLRRGALPGPGSPRAPQRPPRPPKPPPPRTPPRSLPMAPPSSRDAT